MTPKPATSGLMADLLAGVMRLVQGEIALAKAEARQMGQAVAKAVIWAIVALTLGMVGLVLCSQVGVQGLIALGLEPWLATLVMAAVVLVAAALSAALARSRLTAAFRLPSAVARNLRRDVTALDPLETSDGPH